VIQKNFFIFNYSKKTSSQNTDDYFNNLVGLFAMYTAFFSP